MKYGLSNVSLNTYFDLTEQEVVCEILFKKKEIGHREHFALTDVYRVVV